MKSHLILLLWAIAIFPFISSSQILSGRVLDENGQAIPGAYINDLNSSNSAVSNYEGRFELDVKGSKYNIEISHLSYQDKSFNGKYSSRKNYDFILKLEVKKIEEVTISNKRYSKLDGNSGKHIYDYELKGNLIVLLTEENKKNYLEVWSDDLKNKLKFNLSFEPNELVQDCFKNVHVLSDTSYFQLKFKGDQILLDYAKPISDYREFIEPCVASTDSLMIFSLFDKRAKRQFYYALQNDSLNFKLFHTIQDTLRFKSDTLFYNLLDALEQANIGNLSNVPFNMSSNNCSLGLGRTMTEMQMFRDNHLLPTKNNPLIKKDSTFQILDQVNGVSLTISKDSLIIKNTESFNFHKTRGYQDIILNDESHNRLYILCNMQDKYHIMELDEDLHPVSKYEIEDHPFPEEIKINRGYAYYLTRQNRTFSPYIELVRVKM